jgi:hypothetical protein
MKKQLLTICTSTALLALVSTSFAQSSWLQPVRTMVIPAAIGPVELDGVADEEFYSDEFTTIIFDPKVDSGSIGGEDLTATFKVCFDFTHFYVQANITDGVEYGQGNDANDPWTSMNPNDSWQYDNSEIFFDLDTNGVYPTAYDSTCVQLRINRGRDSLMTASANTHALPLIDPKRVVYQANDGDASWMYEVAVPWTAIAPNGSTDADIAAYLAGGMVHGFDISFGDADKIAGVHAARNRQAAWDVEPGYSETTYNNRTQFGIASIINMCFANCDDVRNATTSKLKAYPNPTTGVVKFNDLEGVSSVQVMNLAGQVILTTRLTNNTLDMSQLESGLYLITAREKIIKVSLIK